MGASPGSASATKHGAGQREGTEREKGEGARFRRGSRRSHRKSEMDFAAACRRSECVV